SRAHPRSDARGFAGFAAYRAALRPTSPESSQQRLRLGKAKHQVHILHRLACRSLSQIVDGADHHAAARLRIVSNADVTEIGSRHAVQVGQMADIIKTNERLARVPFLVDR